MSKVKFILSGFFFITTLTSSAFSANINCETIPTFQCSGTDDYCSEIIPFSPDQGLGYDNYTINGETLLNQYRSFARRDLVMLIKYAAAKTYCLSENWPGNGGALGLGDMSEANGAIPGTSINSPGHPAGTHVNGGDMDIAYYQFNTSDNYLRPVCDHTINDKDQYHCISKPELLDEARTALFIGILHHSPQLRVIGVDGQIGPLVEESMNNLCNERILTGSACKKENQKLAYETTDRQRGWYRFHHHHLHVSLSKKKSNN